VGLRAADGRFAAIAHAPRIQVPQAEPGPEEAVEWMEVFPARTRGRELERAVIQRRGPGRPTPRIPGTAGGLPRWEAGAWLELGSSRVPQRPGDSTLTSSSESIPSSPWRWSRK
jgi:hypothetical protein